METAAFAETTDNFQHSTRLNPKAEVVQWTAGATLVDKTCTYATHSLNSTNKDDLQYVILSTILHLPLYQIKIFSSGPSSRALHLVRFKQTYANNFKRISLQR
jgi:hypothetical protein